MSKSPAPAAASASSPPNGGTSMLLVGGVLAVLAVILVNVYAAMLVQKSKAETFTVYEFITSVPAGRPLAKDSIKAFQVPKTFENAFGDNIVREGDLGGLLTDAPKLRANAEVGRLLTYDFVPKNGKEPELKPDPIKNKGDVSVAIKVENLPAALSPGDFVDVQVQVPAGGDKPGMKVMGLMENVRVIAKGELLASDGRTAANASKMDLELTPEQALQVKNVQKALNGAAFEVTVRKRGESDFHGTVPDMAQVNPNVFKALGIPEYHIESN